MKALVVTLVFLFNTSAFAKDIAIEVNGMVCSMCAQGIKKKFKKMPEVKKIDVNLDTKIVSVVTKEDKDLSDDVLTKIITEAGYNVKGITRK